MFGLGGGEIFLVVLLAILLIGPKDLPKVAHQLGRWTRQFRNAINELKTTVENEVGLEDEASDKTKELTVSDDTKSRHDFPGTS